MSECGILEGIGKLMDWRSRGGLMAVVVAAESIVAFADSCQWADELDKSFEMPGEKSIMAAKDCGLVNGLLSVNGWIEDVAEVRAVSTTYRFTGCALPARRLTCAARAPMESRSIAEADVSPLPWAAR